MKVSTVGMIAVAAAAVATPVYAESVFDNAQVAEAWNAATAGFSVADRQQLTAYANDAVALLATNPYAVVDAQSLQGIPETFDNLINFLSKLLDQCADEDAVTVEGKIESCESELRVAIAHVLATWPSEKIDAVDALLGHVFDIAKEFNAVLPSLRKVAVDLGHASGDVQPAVAHMIAALKNFQALTDNGEDDASLSSGSSIVDSVEGNVPALTGAMDFFCGPNVDNMIAGAIRYLHTLNGNPELEKQFGNVAGDLWELIDVRYFPKRDHNNDRNLVIEMMANISAVGTDLVPVVQDVWATKNDTCVLSPQVDFVADLIPDIVAEIKVIMEKMPTPQPSSATQTSAIVAFALALMVLFN